MGAGTVFSQTVPALSFPDMTTNMHTDKPKRGRPPKNPPEPSRVPEILPDDERDECLLTRRSERWLAGLIDADTDETGLEFLLLGHG